ncbi:MAG TPA: hypothetical protein VJ438_00415 [Candidatus Nanoarchaeia archaeon]|nr:hypothetical protein [Candidatus Nanoarchaeia archaeon]
MGLEKDAAQILILPSCGNPEDFNEEQEKLGIRNCTFKGECHYKTHVPIYMNDICTYKMDFEESNH